MIPIDVLIKTVTADDIYEKALDMLEVAKVPARSWREGGVAKTLVGMLAALGAAGAALITSLVRGFFLFYAEGDYLSAHALDVYDVERIPATFATSIDSVKLTNKGGAVHTIGANQLIIRSSNTGARYRVTQAFVLGSGTEASPTTIAVAVSAVEAGAASSVGPAEIDELETTLTKVTVTNTTSIIGRDEETDDQLRKRCLAKKGTWSPFGPRDAYEYAALSAKLLDGTPTSITRVSVSRFSSTGRVTVICATPNGTPTGDELDAVRAECEKIARADAIRLTVSGAIPIATSHVVTLWAKGGTETILQANAQKTLTAFYSTYPIGGLAKSDGGQGYLYLDAISAVIIGSSEEAFDVDFEAGSTDTALDDDEVATNTTAITVRIR